MRKLLFMLLASVMLFGCNGQKKVVKNDVKEKVEIAAKDDSTEYELVVFDPGFESFLVSQPYSKNYYSNNYYRNWNIQYVTEWNYRHDNPNRYGNFYETRIEYDPNIDYGIDLNYRLYQYFQFIRKEYGIVLLSRDRHKGR